MGMQTPQRPVSPTRSFATLRGISSADAVDSSQYQGFYTTDNPDEVPTGMRQLLPPQLAAQPAPLSTSVSGMGPVPGVLGGFNGPQRFDPDRSFRISTDRELQY